ncbi:glutathione synthase [Acinetobacter sp.]|uniref:glutathione synthase n=1 Tax=Acinetobacter sp. TaxID=472 RepID=UPI0035ADB162
MRVLVVMDPIEQVNLKKDSTMAMLWAATRRGHTLSYALQYDLYIDQGKAFGLVAPLQVFEDYKHYYELGEKSAQSLADFDVILMRKDPPFDMNFVYTTYILEQAEREGAWIINKPQSLRDCNEKLFATQFPELQVPTLVTSQQSLIREFLKIHQDVIVKPLDGMGGMGIFRLTADGANIGSTLEMLTENGKLPIMAQRYIPEIVDGDKRILMINGEPVPYCLARIPQNGETRGNLAAGGRGEARPLTENDRKIAEKVGPFLREKGLVFVGLDVIGDYVTEINVTSPTCIREIDDQFGTSIADDLFSFFEKAVLEAGLARS